MLGQLRRTTRLDVGLALSFTGLAYLVWVLVAVVSRLVVEAMFHSTSPEHLPRASLIVKIVFADAGILIDLVGLAWLAVSLLLVVISSRQKLSISWSWVSAVTQAAVAALGAVVVGWAAYQPHIDPEVIGQATPWAQVSFIAMPVSVVLSVLLWVAALAWLLIERAKLLRRGPTLRDGLRSNVR